MQEIMKSDILEIILGGTTLVKRPKNASPIDNI